jgi:hypothetical protein
MHTYDCVRTHKHNRSDAAADVRAVQQWRDKSVHGLDMLHNSILHFTNQTNSLKE